MNRYTSQNGRPRLYATPDEAWAAQLAGQKVRIAGFRARGLCTNCGKKRDRRPLLTCETCLIKDRLRLQRRKEKAA